MDEDKLRERASERVRLKREFITHFAMYLVVNAFLVLIWALTRATYPWFLWPMGGWGVAIVAHAVTLWQKLRELAPHDPAVERELHRLRTKTP